MDGTASVAGLISGLKTDDLINQLVQFERRPIQQYQDQQGLLRQHLSAYQEANTRLQAVQTAATNLQLASAFTPRAATSSNEDILTATTGSGSTPGQYILTVDQLAQAHQVVSQIYGDINATSLGAGTFTITSGGQSTVIQVDSSNNTLGGLRDAINRSNTNVSASIVQDGDASYRLLISSKQTGTANGLTITNALTGGAGPTFSDLQPAQDAIVHLGTGTGSITSTRSSNIVQDLIPGVTVNLVGHNPATQVTVNVSQDNQGVKDAVQKLVDQFNNAAKYLQDQSKFDPEKKTGGVLLGDFTLQNIQNDLADVFTGSVVGPTSGFHSLADVGVSLDGSGMLALDADKLQSALESDPSGVAQVFALTAKSTNASVQLVTAGPKTVVDGTAYSVSITQAAQQSRVTAGTAITGALGANETLTINGVDVAFTTGMTAVQAVAAINARTFQTHATAKLTGADGTGSGSYISLFSNAYGVSATVTAVSNRSSATGDSTGIGNVSVTETSPAGESGSGTGTAGADVAGTINGESATGNGQILVGNAGNLKTDGLRLLITSATTGSLGSIQLFDGIAHKAAGVLDKITNSASGTIQGEEDSLNQRIKDLQDTIDRREEQATEREEQLRTKFNNLESTLGLLQSQSTQLAAQLAKL